MDISVLLFFYALFEWVSQAAAKNPHYTGTGLFNEGCEHKAAFYAQL